MRSIAILMLAVVLLGCGPDVSRTLQQRLNKSIQELAAATNDRERFYALNDAAKVSFDAGKIEDARTYARELIALLPKFQGDWNYGNAVQDANLMDEGRLDRWTQEVRLGKTPDFGANLIY